MNGAGLGTTALFKVSVALDSFWRDKVKEVFLSPLAPAVSYVVVLDPNAIPELLGGEGLTKRYIALWADVTGIDEFRRESEYTFRDQNVSWVLFCDPKEVLTNKTANGETHLDEILHHMGHTDIAAIGEAYQDLVVVRAGHEPISNQLILLNAEHDNAYDYRGALLRIPDSVFDILYCMQALARLDAAIDNLRAHRISKISAIDYAGAIDSVKSYESGVLADLNSWVTTRLAIAEFVEPMRNKGRAADLARVVESGLTVPISKGVSGPWGEVYNYKIVTRLAKLLQARFDSIQYLLELGAEKAEIISLHAREVAGLRMHGEAMSLSKVATRPSVIATIIAVISLLAQAGWEKVGSSIAGLIPWFHRLVE